jgi:hypothetical protein
VKNVIDKKDRHLEDVANAIFRDRSANAKMEQELTEMCAEVIPNRRMRRRAAARKRAARKRAARKRAA